jgi:hypothetical protein
LVYGFGNVAFATFAGFLFGLFVYHQNNTADIQTIQILGFISLLIGMLSMFKVRGLGGILGGFIGGFGLGVTFGTYFVPNSPL